MITIPQANKENDHVRGITAYTPSQTTYIGISTADVFSNDGMYQQILNQSLQDMRELLCQTMATHGTHHRKAR